MLLNFNLYRYFIEHFKWKMLRSLEAVTLLYGKFSLHYAVSVISRCVSCGPMCLLFFCCYHWTLM